MAMPADPLGIPTLTTPRLVLRPFGFGDLDELVTLHAEESFWWYPLRSAMSKDETTGFLERVLARYESDRFGLEAVIDRASGTMIGWAGLAVPHFLPEILPAVEVGWRLSGPWRGRGLATEAGAAALEFGFTIGGLDRIVSIYEPENVASGRVMEHLGFTYSRTTTGPRGNEVVVTELTRAHWEEGRG
jgi:RimJ/RimL family protein N-acetyltransferase